MTFAGFLAICVGILLCVLSANGRLQPTIAAMFGQATPGATPLGSGSGSSGSGSGGGGGLGGLLGGLGGFLNGLGSGGSGGAGDSGGSTSRNE